MGELDWLSNLIKSGVPVWVVLGMGVLWWVVTTFPKHFGAWGAALHDWAMRRRLAAVERDDADIADRDRQIEYFRALADSRAREIAGRDRLTFQHRQWDMDVIVHLPADFRPPPPLFGPVEQSADGS